MALKRSTIVAAVATAFTAIGNIPESVTYRRTSSSYNTATGTNTITNTDYTISVVFSKYNNFEIDKQVVLATDIKALFKQSSLSITPNVATDKIIRSSKTYTILNIGQDPAAATYTLQLRSPT